MATIPAATTDFSAIPPNGSTYMFVGPGFPVPYTMTATDYLSMGWDLTARSSNNSTAFGIQGVNAAGGGDGDSTSLHFQGSDIDSITFMSNAKDTKFDLVSFALRNASSSLLAMWALDINGNTIGGPLNGVLAASSGAFATTSFAGLTQFEGIYGFRIDFSSAADAPYFDSLVISNIVPSTPTTAPTTSVAGMMLSADTGASPADFVTQVAAQHVSGSLSAALQNGERVEVSTDGGVHWADAGSYAVGSDQWSADVVLAGSGEFKARVVNAFGPGSAYGQLYTVDNAPPTGFGLSGGTIAGAGAAAGIAVGTLSAVDGLAVGYGFAIGDGSKDADNARFSIAGDRLNVGASALTAGSYHVYLKATDLAGNISYLAQTITVGAPPAVAAIVRAGAAGALVAASSSSVAYTVTFSESVTGVDAGDFTLQTTGTANASIAGISGSGASYTVTVAGLSGDGTLRLDLNASGTGIQNLGNIAIGAGYTGGAGYTLDHTAPTVAAPSLDPGSNTGVPGDTITGNTTPTLAGNAEAGSTVTLYDGATPLGTSTATGGSYSFTPTLAPGAHSLSVKAVDAAGNVSQPSAPLALTIDTAAAPLAAPTLKPASDSGSLGDGWTNAASPILQGSAEAHAHVQLFDSDGTTVLGAADADASGHWEIASTHLADGLHHLSAVQTDLAGNVSPAGASVDLTIDATAPAAPAKPLLAAASDTGSLGDGITQQTRPLITGTAEAGAVVSLFDSDGSTVLGSVSASLDGSWSIASATLSYGNHLLTARQADRAGNLSAASAALALTISAPPASSDAAVELVDGVAVSRQTVVLPGKLIGVRTTVPIVSAERTDSSGNAGVADIPLAASGGKPLLMAQVPAGFGLSASGVDGWLHDSARGQLMPALAAVSSSGHLGQDAAGFLAGLEAGSALLAQTIVPVTVDKLSGASLVLSGTIAPIQHTALLIDAGAVGAGNTLVLNGVDFAAIAGSVTLSANTRGQLLSADAAAQTIVLDAGLGSTVNAGGGDDKVQLKAAVDAGAASQPTVVRGGQGQDTVAFSGARSDYTISQHEAYLVVTAKAGAHEQATLVNIETLQFADGNVNVQNRAGLSSIAGLYADVLGRQADQGGFDFWGGALAGGASLGHIAVEMIRSGEGQARQFALTGNAEHDIGVLYQAIFHRAADAEGAAFWLEAMRQGVTLEQVADGFMHSAEIVGHAVAAAQWDFWA